MASKENNQDKVASEIPQDVEELLNVLEEANKKLENHAKSLTKLPTSSRNSSESLVSILSTQSEIEQRLTSTDPNEEFSRDTDTTSVNSEANSAEEDSWGLWGQMVNNWERDSKKPILDELVRKGVPKHFRPIVWQLLCGAEKLPEKKLYSGYMTVNSPDENLIRRDINRTYPEIKYFQEKLGQESLFNVIKAYALHDREVGYCQGSAFIVGLLLMHMPEEEAFAVTIKIMKDHKMRLMYKPPMELLGLCLYQLENIVKETLPVLYSHFVNQGIQMSMFASSWFLTIYATVLSVNVSCRIMDIFLLRGIDSVFQFALALLTMYKKDLLESNMEGIQLFFQKDLKTKADEDVEKIISCANSFNIDPKKMKKYSKEYKSMKMKENELEGEIRKLKAENKSYKCIIDSLELESASLAEKLVRFQVEAAKGAETEYALQQKLLEAEHRLQIAKDNHENKGSTESSLEYVAVNKSEIIQRDEIIECLQRELVHVRLLEAEKEVLIKDLKSKINDLEMDKKSLRETAVDNSVARLQEELIAIKMREAEATSYLMESRQSLTELQQMWDKHILDHKVEESGNSSGSDSLSISKKLMCVWENRNIHVHKMEEDLLSSKIRESNAIADLKILNLKVMELETQIQVSFNQLKRQDMEKKSIQQELEEARNSLKMLSIKKREQDHKLNDMKSKHQCEQILSNIKGAEDRQTIAELRQEISALQLKLAEVMTEGQLRKNGDEIKQLPREVLNGGLNDSQDLDEDYELKFDKTMDSDQNSPKST